MKRQLKKFILQIAKFLGFFALARWLTRHKLRILCYHGISQSNEHEWAPALFMRMESIRARLNWLLEKHYKLVSLDEGFRKLSQNRLEPSSVVITFDDGYYNNFRYAQALSLGQKIPCTIYVTSYYLAHQEPVFGLSVEYLFWMRRERAVRVEIPQLEIKAQQLAPGQLAERNALVSEILHKGEALRSEELRLECLKKIAADLEIDLNATLIEPRIFHNFSSAEGHELAKMGVDLQLHTHRHRCPLESGALHDEIERNRKILAPLVTADLVHFCYPNGRWDQSNFKGLQANHILTATTCEAGLNSPQTHPLALSRFLDREDLSNLEIESELTGFGDFLRLLANPLRRPRAVHKS